MTVELGVLDPQRIQKGSVKGVNDDLVKICVGCAGGGRHWRQEFAGGSCGQSGEAAAAVPAVQKLDDDQYPHMHKALEDLRAARHSLENAEPRFKGHRDKAIEHVDKAIKECRGRDC